MRHSLFVLAALLCPVPALAAPDPEPQPGPASRPATETDQAGEAEQVADQAPPSAGQLNAARYTINPKDCPATAGDEIREKLQGVEGIKTVRQLTAYEFEVYYDPQAFELQKAVEIMKGMGYPPAPSRPIAGSIEDEALRLQASTDKVTYKPGQRGRIVAVLYPKDDSILQDVKVATTGTAPEVKPGREPQTTKAPLDASKLKDGREILVFPVLVEGGAKPGVYLVKLRTSFRPQGEGQVERALALEIPVTVVE